MPVQAHARAQAVAHTRQSAPDRRVRELGRLRSEGVELARAAQRDGHARLLRRQANLDRRLKLACDVLESPRAEVDDELAAAAELRHGLTEDAADTDTEGLHVRPVYSPAFFRAVQNLTCRVAATASDADVMALAVATSSERANAMADEADSIAVDVARHYVNTTLQQSLVDGILPAVHHAGPDIDALIASYIDWGEASRDLGQRARHGDEARAHDHAERREAERHGAEVLELQFAQRAYDSPDAIHGPVEALLTVPITTSAALLGAGIGATAGAAAGAISSTAITAVVAPILALSSPFSVVVLPVAPLLGTLTGAICGGGIGAEASMMLSTPAWYAAQAIGRTTDRLLGSKTSRPDGPLTD